MWHLRSVSSETPNFKWSVLRCIPPYSNISKKWKNWKIITYEKYEKLEIVTYQNQKGDLNSFLNVAMPIVPFKELHPVITLDN